MTQDKSEKIVILGAGIAGLKAASYLYSMGYTNLEMIEARERIGGRLYTVQGLNGKYDLGASWHHDLLINTLFKEEQDLGEAHRGAPYTIEDDLPGLVDEMGKRLDSCPEVRLEPVVEEFESYITNIYNPSLSKDTNLFNGVINYLVKYKKNLTKEQIKYMLGRARYYELWHGTDWKQISSFDTLGEHQGRNALVSGHSGIVNRISKTFPIDAILKLNTQVKEINVLTNETSKKVEIKTYDTVKKIRSTIIADYVIVTIPLSLLKMSIDPKMAKEKGVIKFTPPFQPRLSRAIDNISFGSLGKIAFEFDKLCWSTEKSRMLYMGKNQDAVVPLIESNDTVTPQLLAQIDALVKPGAVPNCNNYPYFIVNLAKSMNGMPSLLFLCSEPVTKYLESLNGNVEKLFQYFEPALNSVLKSLHCEKNVILCNGSGKQKVGAPSGTPVLKNIVCTSWTQDPFSRGGYTVVKPGDDLEGFVNEIKKGHEDVVRFAGEACVVTGNGCTWGATTSAVREVDAIVTDINKSCRSCKL